MAGFWVVLLKNIGFHKIEDYFYEFEAFVGQEVLCSMLLAQYFRTKQTKLPAVVYCNHKNCFLFTSDSNLLLSAIQHVLDIWFEISLKRRVVFYLLRLSFACREMLKIVAL